MDLILSYFSGTWLGMPVWAWLSFLLIVLTMLTIDLGVFHREAHAPSMTESVVIAGTAMTLGLSFSVVVWWLYYSGAASSLDAVIAGAATPSERAWTAWELYLTGWVVEQTLAFDNVFVISMIFTYFAIPPKYQHRVLFYGILGVIVLRAIMIGLGAALVHQFGWILYLFSAFLIFTGIKMIMMADQKLDLESNPLLIWMRKRVRVTKELHGQNFFVNQPDPKTGKVVRYATPLFLAIVLIEFADLIFAVDSVPAIFAITQDPFIVYTSNIFAILGLRALYFLLSAMVDRFHYLKYALALVLVFVGAKIFLQQLIGKISPEVSLGVIMSLLIGGIVYSLIRTRSSEPAKVADQA
ncbi:MAG: TerC family protein [Hyphomicrobiaceae bacterium]|nr:TerC family protein [Hyphomicrobiaceae bacterium]